MTTADRTPAQRAMDRAQADNKLYYAVVRHGDEDRAKFFLAFGWRVCCPIFDKSYSFGLLKYTAGQSTTRPTPGPNVALPIVGGRYFESRTDAVNYINSLSVQRGAWIDHKCKRRWEWIGDCEAMILEA